MTTPSAAALKAAEAAARWLLSDEDFKQVDQDDLLGCANKIDAAFSEAVKDAMKAIGTATRKTRCGTTKATSCRATGATVAAVTTGARSSIARRKP